MFGRAQKRASVMRATRDMGTGLRTNDPFVNRAS